MEPKTKQSLLVTVVGVTLFVALLRLSDVLAFAAKLIDLVLPILAGGILALFINVPMTGLEKRLNRLRSGIHIACVGAESIYERLSQSVERSGNVYIAQ